mmetsp:Transcript_65805/g.133855  ORF Transcript_65805/g.133855 Transcript_65805/m.133855 type:complete len:257 (-) Transcript_65805:174-944(-)
MLVLYVVGGKMILAEKHRPTHPTGKGCCFIVVKSRCSLFLYILLLFRLRCFFCSTFFIGALRAVVFSCFRFSVFVFFRIICRFGRTHHFQYKLLHLPWPHGAIRSVFFFFFARKILKMAHLVAQRQKSRIGSNATNIHRKQICFEILPHQFVVGFLPLVSDHDHRAIGFLESFVVEKLAHRRTVVVYKARHVTDVFPVFPFVRGHLGNTGNIFHVSVVFVFRDTIFVDHGHDFEQSRAIHADDNHFFDFNCRIRHV